MTSPNAEPTDANLAAADPPDQVHEHRGTPDNPCQSALDGLYEYVDGEMTEAGRRQLEMHLADCVGCENVFGFEQQVKRLITKRGRTRCPDEVRTRLVAMIHSYSVEIPPDS